jgi:hypothetical protein
VRNPTQGPLGQNKKHSINKIKYFKYILSKGKFWDIQTNKIWGWTINNVLFVSISISYYYKKWVGKFNIISKITFQKV